MPIIVPIIGFVVGAYLGGSFANGTFNVSQWNWSSPQTYVGIAFGGVAGAFLSSIGYGLVAASGYSFSLSLGFNDAFVNIGISSNSVALQGIGYTTVAGGTFYYRFNARENVNNSMSNVVSIPTSPISIKPVKQKKQASVYVGHVRMVAKGFYGPDRQMYMAYLTDDGQWYCPDLEGLVVTTSGRLEVVPVAGGYVEIGEAYSFENGHFRTRPYAEAGWGFGINIGFSANITYYRSIDEHKLTLNDLEGWSNSYNYTVWKISYSQGSNYKNWQHAYKHRSLTNMYYDFYSIGYSSGIGFSFTKGKTWFIFK